MIPYIAPSTADLPSHLWGAEISGFSPSTIPILGDQSIAWFDPAWPWDLGTVQHFISAHDDAKRIIRPKDFDRNTMIEIDFSKAQAVAMFAGRADVLWDECECQQMLLRVNEHWIVITRGISKSEIVKQFRDNPDEAEYAIQKRPFSLAYDFGIEGNFAESWSLYDHGRELIGQKPRKVTFNRKRDSTNPNSRIPVKSIGSSEDLGDPEYDRAEFQGDLTLLAAIDWLSITGFVQSKFWQTIVNAFPMLNAFQEYLIFTNQLHPDGSHPLHAKTKSLNRDDSNVDRQSNESSDKISGVPTRESEADRVHALLTGQPARLFYFLMQRWNFVTFDTLRETFHSTDTNARIFSRADVTDEAITKAIKRLKDNLLDTRFECQIDGSRVKLEYLK